MILVTFRHGLRAAEVCDLRWDQVDFNGAVLHVRRVKNGTPSTHPFHGDELRALRRLQRESPPSPFVFVSERGSPFTTAGFARMVERAAAGASLELKAHPHMLRHACGYALANKGYEPGNPGVARLSIDHQHSSFDFLETPFYRGPNALMYLLGHGSWEAAAICGISLPTNLALESPSELSLSAVLPS
jgi:integrase